MIILKISLRLPWGETQYFKVPKNPYDPFASVTTKGLKISVNSDDQPAESSVSLFPKGLNVDGDHALRFHMFMSYNGPAYGGSGSTELATMGVGHSVSWSPFFVGMVPWTAMEPSSQFLVKGVLLEIIVPMSGMVLGNRSFWMSKPIDMASRTWMATE